MPPLRTTDSIGDGATTGAGGKLTFDADVRYCYISRFNLYDGKTALAAHVVLKNKNADLNTVFTRINGKLKKYFPEYLIPSAYRIYENFLPEALAWNKTDRKLLSSYTDGYVRPSDNGLINVKFIKDSSSGLYSINETLR